MNQPIVEFHNPFSIASEKLKYSIICSRYQDNWVFVRHKLRNTWEMPAGHIEKDESALFAAKRELYEETGATQFSLRTLSIIHAIGMEKLIMGESSLLRFNNWAYYLILKLQKSSFSKSYQAN